MSNHSYRHILKYTGFFGLVQASNIVLHVLRGKLVAMLLGTAGVGLIEVFNRTNDLMGALTNLGLPVSGIRHIAQAKGEAPPAPRQTLRYAVLLVRTWGMVAALLGAMATLAIAPLLARMLSEEEVSATSLMGLAPLVALSTLSGIEWAVLKGLQRLRLVALCTLWGAVALLLSAGLCLVLWQADGIVAMMTLSMLLLLLLQVWGNREVAWRITCHWRVLGRSWPWVRLGLYFNAGLALTSASEMAIRALMLRWGSLHDVGLYTAGVVVLTAYTRLVFSSAEADFFPRLSATTTREAMTIVVNRQVEVYVALMGACLCVLVVLLPWLVPLLYTADFVGSIPMATVAACYMLCKAVATPVAYITLARGDNRHFFVLELCACLTQVLAVAMGYRCGGLVGAGLGLTASHALYLAYVLLATRWRYGYLMGARAWGLLGVQALALSLCCVAAFVCPTTTWGYWSITAVATLCSVAVALWQVRRGWREA